MRFSSLIPILLAVMGISFAGAPPAKATILGNPVASVKLKGSVELADYYYRRSYKNCYRPYAKHYGYGHKGYGHKGYGHKRYYGHKGYGHKGYGKGYGYRDDYYGRSYSRKYYYDDY